MSEANGVHVGGDESVKPVNRIGKAKPKAKPTGTSGFYERLGKRAGKKSLTLTASDAEGKVTLSVKSFPALTAEAVKEASRGGVQAKFTPTDTVDGRKASASYTGEGEDGYETAADFFAIETVD